MWRAPIIGNARSHRVAKRTSRYIRDTVRSRGHRCFHLAVIRGEGRDNGLNTIQFALAGFELNTVNNHTKCKKFQSEMQAVAP